MINEKYKETRRRNKKQYRDKITFIRIELYPTDADIKEYLDGIVAEGVPKSTYIKNLIRREMGKTQ